MVNAVESERDAKRTEIGDQIIKLPSTRILSKRFNKIFQNPSLRAMKLADHLGGLTLTPNGIISKIDTTVLFYMQSLCLFASVDPNAMKLFVPILFLWPEYRSRVIKKCVLDYPSVWKYIQPRLATSGPIMPTLPNNFYKYISNNLRNLNERPSEPKQIKSQQQIITSDFLTFYYLGNSKARREDNVKFF